MNGLLLGGMWDTLPRLVATFFVNLVAFELTVNVYPQPCDALVIGPTTDTAKLSPKSTQNYPYKPLKVSQLFLSRCARASPFCGGVQLCLGRSRPFCTPKTQRAWPARCENLLDGFAAGGPWWVSLSGPTVRGPMKLCPLLYSSGVSG